MRQGAPWNQSRDHPGGGWGEQPLRQGDNETTAFIPGRQVGCLIVSLSQQGFGPLGCGSSVWHRSGCLIVSLSQQGFGPWGEESRYGIEAVVSLSHCLSRGSGLGVRNLGMASKRLSHCLIVSAGVRALGGGESRYGIEAVVSLSHCLSRVLVPGIWIFLLTHSRWGHRSWVEIPQLPDGQGHRWAGEPRFRLCASAWHRQCVLRC